MPRGSLSWSFTRSTKVCSPGFGRSALFGRLPCPGTFNSELVIRGRIYDLFHSSRGPIAQRLEQPRKHSGLVICVGS